MPSQTEIALWGKSLPEWLGTAIATSGRSVCGIGGGADAGAAARLGAQVHPDIRTFARHTRGAPLLCTDLLSADDAALLAEDRPIIFAVEPLPIEACAGSRAPRVCLLPGISRDSTIAQAGDAAAEAGQCRHVLFVASAPEAHGSILARVADAARAIVMWMGMPDGVACALSDARLRAVRDDRPDAASRAMAEFRGTMSCLLRYADSRGAAIVACAGAHAWERRVHIQLSRETIAADDGMMVRLDERGAELERAEAATRGAGIPSAIAAQCLSSDGALERARPESLHVHCVSLVEAICLSAITGEWEEPARIEDLLTRSSRFADD